MYPHPVVNVRMLPELLYYQLFGILSLRESNVCEGYGIREK